MADSSQSLGWSAVSLNNLALPSEIAQDYLGDGDVQRWLVTAKAAKLSGSGERNARYWVITHDELPDELIDSDEATADASGAPTLRASTDVLGLSQIPLHVLEFSPASGGAAGGATAEINLNVLTADHTNGQAVYLWWGKSGKTQPAADEAYGSEAVYEHAGNWTKEDFSDSSSNANDGSGTGMSTTTDVPFGALEAYEFDALADRISVPDDNSLDITDALTVFLWFKCDADTGTFQGLLSKRVSFNSVNYSLAFEVSDTIDWNLYNGGFKGIDADFATYFGTGSWHFIAATMKQNGSQVEFKLYNGPGGLIGLVSYTVERLRDFVNGTQLMHSADEVTFWARIGRALITALVGGLMILLSNFNGLLPELSGIVQITLSAAAGLLSMLIEYLRDYFELPAVS